MTDTREARISKIESLVRMSVPRKDWDRYAKAKAYEKEAIRAWNELGRLWCDLQNDRFAIWDEMCEAAEKFGSKVAFEDMKEAVTDNE